MYSGSFLKKIPASWLLIYFRVFRIHDIQFQDMRKIEIPFFTNKILFVPESNKSSNEKWPKNMKSSQPEEGKEK